MNISEPDKEPDSGLDESLEEYIANINKGYIIIKTIEQKTELLKKEKAKMNHAVDSEKKKEISAKVNSLLEEFNGETQKMKQITEKLKETDDKKSNTEKEKNENSQIMTEKNTETPIVDKDSPEYRIKNNLFKSLIKRYQDACKNFQSTEEAIKTIMQNNLIRAAEIATDQRLTQQQKYELIDNPETIQKFYEDKLTGKAHVKLQNAVADLEERHRDIVKMSKSYKELHKLIEELKELTNYQGEMIDNICDNISASKDYIEKGVENLTTAKQNLRKASKKKCIVLVIVAVVLALVVVIPICVKFV